MFGSGKGNAERSTGGGRLTPVDVQQVQFRLAFRGYNERDVDAFLDRVTEDLTARIDERDRLVRQLEAGGGAGAMDIAAARAEAEAIVARAREEGQEILRRAMADAAAARAGASGSAAPVDQRAALAPFLAKEKEFLARIGSMVQGHAEDIRGMVQEIRASGGGEPRG
jgi:DivIVA domain-containing protein